MSWNQQKMNSLLTLYLNHFDETKPKFGRTLRNLYLFFLIFLRYCKVNLQTSTYIFYKSTVSAKSKYAAFDTVLKKSSFCDGQISSKHLRSPQKRVVTGPCWVLSTVEVW